MNRQQQAWEFFPGAGSYKNLPTGKKRQVNECVNRGMRQVDYSGMGPRQAKRYEINMFRQLVVDCIERHK